jgi:hypothetical protein
MVPSFTSVTEADVIAALDEYDARGQEDFLDSYGFEAALEYLLWRDGKSYESEAILGVAHKYAVGTIADSAELPDGTDGAAQVLRDLGFEVTAVESADVPDDDGWRNASDIGTEAAREAWALSARDVLIEVARRYHSTITYKEVSSQVQDRTRIRATQAAHYWIGDVLGRVAAENERRGEPLLSSLCVNVQGSVGDAYSVAVKAARGETPADGDDHGALERLACHTYFEAPDLPANGGVAALTSKLAGSRSRARKAAIAERPANICPTCHMQIPATGVCDNCG